MTLLGGGKRLLCLEGTLGRLMSGSVFARACQPFLGKTQPAACALWDRGTMKALIPSPRLEVCFQLLTWGLSWAVAEETLFLPPLAAHACWRASPCTCVTWWTGTAPLTSFGQMTSLNPLALKVPVCRT